MAMHRLAFRRIATWAAVVWLITILSAELLHFAIEESSQTAQRECPVCLFHSTHGQVSQPETILTPVFVIAWVECATLPRYAQVLPTLPLNRSCATRAPPVLAL
ncbi:MAG: hypothetical protein WHS44_09725 [Fimbriimonadales bacterium]